MWEIYDELIEGIPEEIRVSDYTVGCTATYVCSNRAMGICETVLNNQIPSNIKYGADISLKSMAQGLKSWNSTEASLGLAAVNCWYNSPELLESRGMGLREIRRNPFNSLKSAVENKKIALISHIDYLEEIFAKSSQLSVIADTPRDTGDFPTGALDFILQKQNFVFADGKSIIRKKLPRLLELSDKIIFVGVGVPLSDSLIKAGAMELKGFCVTNQPLCKQLIAVGTPVRELLAALSFATLQGADK